MIDIRNLQYSHIISDKNFNEIILEQMECESDLLFSCMETNIILEAEVSKVKSIGEKFKALFDSIVEFFNKIMTSFKNKLKELLDYNKKWFDENIGKFDNLNYEGLDIEVIPFWNVQSSEITGILDVFSGLINKVPNGDKLNSLSSRESIENLPQIKKYKPNNMDLADGLQKYFKVGNKELKPIKISGNQLKGYCTGEFKNYIIDYHKNIITTIQSRIDKMNSELKQVQRVLNTTKPVGESYCLLENAFYKNTELKYCYNHQILFEAEQDANQQNQNTNNTQQPNQSNDTKVDTKSVVVNDTKKNNADDNKYNNSSVDELTYVKNIVQINQLAIGTAMNVYEERYKVYINILRQVLKARAPKNS